MPQLIEAHGRQFEFPDSATEQQISDTLKAEFTPELRPLRATLAEGGIDDLKRRMREFFSPVIGLTGDQRQEIEAASGGIIPAARAAETTGQPGVMEALSKPAIEIPQFPEAKTTGGKIAAGVGNVAVGVGNFIQSPLGVATLALSGGTGALRRAAVDAAAQAKMAKGAADIAKLADTAKATAEGLKAANAINRTVAGGFSADMLSGVPGGVQRTVEAAKEGDLQRAVTEGGGALLGAGLGTAAGRHALPTKKAQAANLARFERDVDREVAKFAKKEVIEELDKVEDTQEPPASPAPPEPGTVSVGPNTVIDLTAPGATIDAETGMASGPPVKPPEAAPVSRQFTRVFNAAKIGQKLKSETAEALRIAAQEYIDSGLITTPEALRDWNTAGRPRIEAPAPPPAQDSISQAFAKRERKFKTFEEEAKPEPPPEEAKLPKAFIRIGPNTVIDMTGSGDASAAPPSTPKAGFKATVYQGRGFTPEQIYGEEAVAAGRAHPILGPGEYYAETPADAKNYGDTVTKHSVQLDNPLVIDSDAAWRDLITQSGATSLNSRGRDFYDHPERIEGDTKKLQAHVSGLGHDGIIVKVPQVGDMNARGESIKGLVESFGHSQIVKFRRATKAPKPPAVPDDIPYDDAPAGSKDAPAPPPAPKFEPPPVIEEPAKAPQAVDDNPIAQRFAREKEQADFERKDAQMLNVRHAKESLERIEKAKQANKPKEEIYKLETIHNRWLNNLPAGEPAKELLAKESHGLTELEIRKIQEAELKAEVDAKKAFEARIKAEEDHLWSKIEEARSAPVPDQTRINALESSYRMHYGSIRRRRASQKVQPPATAPAKTLAEIRKENRENLLEEEPIPDRAPELIAPKEEAAPAPEPPRPEIKAEYPLRTDPERGLVDAKGRRVDAKHRVIDEAVPERPADVGKTTEPTAPPEAPTVKVEIREPVADEVVAPPGWKVVKNGEPMGFFRSEKQARNHAREIRGSVEPVAPVNVPGEKLGAAVFQQQADLGKFDVQDTPTIEPQAPKLLRPAKVIPPHFQELKDSRPPDLIDVYEQEIGLRAIDLKSIRDLAPDFVPVGAARSIIRGTGRVKIDDVRSVLERATGKSWNNDADVAEALNSAARQRKEHAEKFWRNRRDLKDAEEKAQAFSRDANADGPKKTRVWVDDNLNEGDAFTIEGHKLRVTEMFFDSDGNLTSIRFDDGKNYGVQVVEHGTELLIDRGSFERRPQKAQEPPAFQMDKPESVEEAKARETSEAQAAKKKADAEKIAQLANKKLVGSSGDIGQMDMLGGGDLFSNPKIETKAKESLADRIIRENKGNMSAMPLDVIVAYAWRGARYAVRVAWDRAAWAGEMVREFGRSITPNLGRIWRETVDRFSDPKSSPATPEDHVFGENSFRRRARELPEKIGRFFEEARSEAHQAKMKLRAWEEHGTIAAGMDTVMNDGKQFGGEVALEQRHALNRQFGVTGPAVLKVRDELAESAVTQIVEAGFEGDGVPGEFGINELREFRKTVLEGENARPEDRRNFLRANDFALRNYEKLAPIARNISRILKLQHDQEVAAGVKVLWRDRYMPHMQDADIDMIAKADGGGGIGMAAPHMKIKDYPTFADSVAGGEHPVSMSAIDLMQARLSNGRQQINARIWLESMMGITDPTTGKPILATVKKRTRADGKVYWQAKDRMYSVEEFAGQHVGIHNGYQGLFHDLTSPSAFRDGTWRPMVTKGTAVAKHIVLQLDTFHLGRLALWNATTRLGLPTYRRGLILANSTMADLRIMAERGEIPKEWIKDAAREKAVLDLLTQQGYNMSRIADNLHIEWVQMVPISGRFNKWLFESYQRGAMAECGLYEFAKQKAARPELSDAQVARLVAKNLNVRFGNLNNQSWIKSKTMQDLARIIFLAPQWNESLIRAEAGAAWQTMRAPLDSIKGRRIVYGTLGRTVATAAAAQFVANQLINLSTRGVPTWENPEEGHAAKLSAWIPDVVGGGPGYFWNPMSIPMEITHLALKGMERTGSFGGAVRAYVRGRLNTTSRPAWVLATQQDVMGRNLRDQSEIMWSAFTAGIPFPISAGAFGRSVKQLFTGEHEERFPGEFERQATQSLGMKLDNAPTYSQRIGALAKEYNHARGVVESALFYTSDFEPLERALKLDNKREQARALEDLLKKKTAEQVLQHFARRGVSPFTKSQQAEREFVKTLSREQWDAYKKAREEQNEVVRRFNAMADRTGLVPEVIQGKSYRSPRKKN